MPGKAINFLIVDDSKFARMFIKRILKAFNLPLGNVVEAQDGKEGLEILKTVNIDVALLDIHMPIMSGREMHDLMKKDPKLSKIPIIFITSESSSESIKMLFKTGVRYIRKPFTPELLYETVVAVLEETDKSSV